MLIKLFDISTLKSERSLLIKRANRLNGPIVIEEFPWVKEGQPAQSLENPICRNVELLSTFSRFFSNLGFNIIPLKQPRCRDVGSSFPLASRNCRSSPIEINK